MNPQRLADEDKLDETLRQTFPASDAPANTVETGIQVDVESSPLPAEVVVRDNAERQRFEAVVDGHVASLAYERRPDEIVFLHTEVPEALRGRGIANQLAKAGLEAARAAHLRFVVYCPFVRAYLDKHPEARGI
jgi:predicted GNAT family acetyltransferase